MYTICLVILWVQIFTNQFWNMNVAYQFHHSSWVERHSDLVWTWWLVSSLGPRPKTNPSMNCFQYRMEVIYAPDEVWGWDYLVNSCGARGVSGCTAFCLATSKERQWCEPIRGQITLKKSAIDLMAWLSPLQTEFPRTWKNAVPLWQVPISQTSHSMAEVHSTQPQQIICPNQIIVQQIHFALSGNQMCTLVSYMSTCNSPATEVHCVLCTLLLYLWW